MVDLEMPGVRCRSCSPVRNGSSRRVGTDKIRVEIANPCPNLSDRLVDELNRKTTELSVEIREESKTTEKVDDAKGQNARPSPAQPGLRAGLRGHLYHGTQSQFPSRGGALSQFVAGTTSRFA